MDKGVKQKRHTINGIEIAYYEAGTGEETVVLLHGAGVDSALMSWTEVVRILSGKYRTIAPDLPGYGESGRFGGVYSLGFYADTVKEFLEAVAGRPVILAGLSLGGGICLDIALRYPNAIKALVPVDAWGLFDKLPWHRLTHWYAFSSLNERLYAWSGRYRSFVKWSLTTNLFGDASKVTDELIDEVQKEMLVPGAGKPFISFQRSEITRNSLNTDLFGSLNRIAAPTLLVHGGKDKAVPLKGAVEAQKRIPDCELYIMEGCRHWPQKERPEEFCRVLNDYLDRRLREC